MKNSSYRKNVRSLVLRGLAIGLCLPVVAVIIEILSRGLPFSWGSFWQVHKETPAMFILYLAPLILAFAARIIGKDLALKKIEVEQARIEERKQSEKILEFTEKLTEGNTDVEYTLDKTDNGTDEIGNSLLRLRDYLKKNRKEEETRREQEHQQNWVTEGLAKFGDILRHNNDNIEDLSYDIISNLVNYVDAKQGGVFIINDNDPENKYFELTACYAYSRKKFLEKRIEWEEGLVGACALEQQTILLTDVPEDHVSITSGLGEAKPGCIILVPLKVNEEVHGVIELASLKIFREFEIHLLEKLAENIASVISGVKVNIKTAMMLKESQEQAKVLASQEDEMRRNMEELTYAKEEAAKQGELLASFTTMVNHSMIRAEYSTQGILLYANTRFLIKLGYSSNKEVEGKHISIFIDEKDKEWFFKIWDPLAKGGKHYKGDMKHVTKQGKDFWAMATYTCARNSDGSIEKILFLGVDITDQKKQNLDYQAQMDTLNRSSIKVEYSLDGSILDANSKFLELSEIPKEKLSSYTVYNFIEESNEASFKKIWQNILKGIPYETQFKLVNPLGQERWIEGSCNAVRDMYGEVTKVIYLASDITRKKMVELENQKQTQLLKQQEDQLRKQQEEIKRQHEEFKAKMQLQISEIEAIKVRNEKTLESAVDAIVTIDKNETVQFFNKAAEELWGISRNEVLGKSIKILLPPAYSQVKDGEIITFLTSEKNHLKGNRTEAIIVNKNSDQIPVLLALSEVKTGNDYTYTAFVQNITVELH